MKYKYWLVDIANSMAHTLSCHHNTHLCDICHGNMGTAISHLASGGSFPAG